MPQIHVLDQETINQIAAGEVVERPMAVVKELVENAIDAGANAITVEIRDGGKALIRITDNGCGIGSEDIRLAFAPHATSKISEVEDLLEVSSLGFRGEALSSVAAVSQLEMVTKTRDALMGSRYVMEGGEEKALESVGCPEGTTFIVRNLFYNTPARLKFLKTSPTEAGYINTVLERLALSHPEIAFRFINQNQPKLTTPGNGNLKDVIYHIYGRDISSNLLEVHTEEVYAKVDGFLGKPVISRGNRNFMNYFINGRYIRSHVIHRAIEEAYSQYTMQHRYPFTVLHLTINPKYIDVNVHPQKMELRFTKEQEIFQSVYHAVSEGLKKREFIPEVHLQTPKKAEQTKSRGTEPFETKRLAKERKAEQSDTEKEIPSIPANTIGSTEDSGILSAEKIVAQPVRQDVTAEREVREPDKEQKTDERQKADKIQNSDKKQNSNDKQNFNEKLNFNEKHIPEELQKQADAVAEQAPDYGQKQAKPIQQSLFEEGELAEQATREIRIIGQVFSTYWIMEYEDKMYMVDQHAAHEKVLYERFMKSLREKQPMIQMVQPPIVLTLSMTEQQALTEHEDLFASLGFQIESFGGREYAVSGVPAHLPSVNTEDLLIEALDMLSEYHGGKTPEVLLDRVATMSCKAAVKGNNKLDVRQAEELIREMMTLENPYHCPHGRPTMISMTKRELEKKFKRIV